MAKSAEQAGALGFDDGHCLLFGTGPCVQSTCRAVHFAPAKSITQSAVQTASFVPFLIYIFFVQFVYI